MVICRQMIESLLHLDENLYILINSGLSNPLFDAVLIPFRHKLFWVPLYLAIICFILLNYGRLAWLTLIALILTVVISDTVSSKLIKKSVKRTRPCNQEHIQSVERVHCGHGYSFTSSHATNHYAVGSFLFLLLSMTRWRWSFMCWAGVIGFAQIYVGVHFPFDVIIGSVLGCIIGWIVFMIYTNVYSKLTNKYLQT